MLKRVAFFALLCGTAAAAMPPPPPAPDVMETQREFFDLLPELLPVEHAPELRAMIAEDLVVTRDGEPLFDNRDDWLAWRESFTDSDRIERFQMLRDSFYEDGDKRIVVREFWVPFREGATIHPLLPHKFVRYSFADGKLVGVDYLLALERAGWLKLSTGEGHRRQRAMKKPSSPPG